MNSIDSTRSEILGFLTAFQSNSNSVVARLRNAHVQKDESLADLYSLLSDDDYNEEDSGMTVKQFTNLNSYLTVMNSLYGNSSASKFKQALNNVLNAGKNSQIANAQTFIQKMRDNGLSNSTATKMYKALNSYSLVSNMQTLDLSSYVSATI